MPTRNIQSSSYVPLTLCATAQTCLLSSMSATTMISLLGQGDRSIYKAGKKV